MLALYSLEAAGTAMCANRNFNSLLQTHQRTDLLALPRARPSDFLEGEQEKVSRFRRFTVQPQKKSENPFNDPNYLTSSLRLFQT